MNKVTLANPAALKKLLKEIAVVAGITNPLAKVEEVFTEAPPEKWKPRNGQVVWVIDGLSYQAREWDETNIWLVTNYKKNLVKETEGQAEYTVNKIKQLLADEVCHS